MTPALTLTGLIMIPLVGMMVIWRQEPAHRRHLITLLTAALTIRVILTVVLDATGAWQITGRGAVTPDEATVDLAARLLTGGDPRSPLVLGGSLHASWLLASWAVYTYVWNDLLAVKLLSALLGSLLVIPCYLLAKELSSARAARLAGWGIVLLPTALVWSALALRESFIALLISTLILLVVITPVTPKQITAWCTGVTVGMILLAYTRSYMTPLVMGLLASVAIIRMRSTPVHVAAALSSVGLAVGAIWVMPAGQELVTTTIALVVEPAGSVYNPLSDCTDAQDCKVVADPRSATAQRDGLAGAAIRPDNALPEKAPGESRESSHTNDLDASLQSVDQKGAVRAFTVALLAGRPVWRTAEFFFLLQPGVVAWWVLLPSLCVGSVVLLKRRRWDGLLVTVGFVTAMVVFLAFTGQFIRHHFMLEPIGVVLAATGLASLRKRDIESAFEHPRAVRRITYLATGVMAAGAMTSIGVSLV